ncbi:TPA: hypothetical protein NHH84_003056 [Legionella pneumophila]|nr:hypothetical protein [Legionella pneumophila]
MQRATSPEDSRPCKARCELCRAKRRRIAREPLQRRSGDPACRAGAGHSRYPPRLRYQRVAG